VFLFFFMASMTAQTVDMYTAQARFTASMIELALLPFKNEAHLQTSRAPLV
jgi:hypothetical protein